MTAAARAAAVGTVVLVASLSSSPARAGVDDEDVCRADARAAHHGAGPLPSGIAVADFGLLPEACPAFDVLARLRGVLLVADDAPDFYGNVAAGFLLRVRHPLERRTWLSVGLDTVTYRYVANAVVPSSSLSLGPPTFGLYHRLSFTRATAVAVYARVLLPLDTARDEGVETGGELGLTTWLPLGARLGLQGGLALPAPVVITAGQAHGALRPAVLAEAFWLAHPGIALVAGGVARSEVTPRRSLRSLGARAAASFAFEGGLRLALAVEVPLVGDDRTDLAGSILLTWTAPAARAAP